MAELAARMDVLEREVAALRAGTLPREAVRPQPIAAPPAPPPAPVFAMPPTAPRVIYRAQAPPKPAKTLEERFGSQLFNMIGIAAIFIAASLALKLAIDKGLIGPAARVLIGIVAGVGVVLWSESFRRKGLKAFSWSMKAIGTGVLYLSLWAAFQMYHLMPDWAALGAMILVTAWNAFMAWSQDAELLAAYALAGGFATPLLLSTGGDHEIFLFTYVAALDLGLVLLIRSKPWTRLLLPSLAATAIYFFGWFSAHYPHVWTFYSSKPTPLPEAFWPTVGFTLVFFALFAALSVRGFLRWPESEEGPRTTDLTAEVLIPLANTAMLALALMLTFSSSGLRSSQAWLMVTLAALYLGLMRIQRSGVSSALHLACAVVFLTVAIPLKARGHSLTIAWLVEGLVLLWVSTRFANEQTDDAKASVSVLRVLSAIGYALGLAALIFRIADDPTSTDFLTAAFGSALVAAAVLAGAAWLGQAEDNVAICAAALTGIDLVGLLLAVPALFDSNRYPLPAAFASAGFGHALVGLVLLAAATWSAWQLGRDRQPLASCRQLAAGTMILTNLVTILVFVHEIGLLFRAGAGAATANADADLQRSLAISGFLMAYGAILLTAGFLRRSAFTRWQALILILFTICKVFLYDLSALSQGYRIASIFALGALLMGISLAYQKDWLGLRAAKPAASSETTEEPR